MLRFAALPLARNLPISPRAHVEQTSIQTDSESLTRPRTAALARACRAVWYESAGRLVRRWTPAHRRLSLEAWTGDAWAPHGDVDHILRYGRRLSEDQALALLHAVREGAGSWSRLTEAEARQALCDRRRRA
jgi:hypothetical protein